MKRLTQIAVVGATLLAGYAQAQSAGPASSNVTLFGIVDVYAGKVQLASRPTVTAVNPGALTTSRWGVQGSEDLGDGLRANFSLVALFRPDTGAPGRFDGDAFFSSRSTVGLSGGFGQVNLGRMNSPLFFSLLRFDPHELGGQTPTFLHTYPGGQPLLAPQATADSTINNGIQYATPTWNGLSATVHAGLAETAGKTKGRSGWNLTYANGPLALGAAGDSIDAPVQVGATHQAAWMVAGSYDFQVAKLSAIHQVQKLTGVGDVYRIDTLGATVPVGASKLMFSVARTQADRLVGVDPQRTTYALTYDYFLSKRTDVYVHGMVDQLTGVARGTTLLAGLRHRF